MAQKPSENGIEGVDDEEEETENEEEDEPRLKYQRMGGSIASLLSNDAASCIAVAERMIALGTHNGTVHILDLLGNQVKELSAHTATVNDLSFDIEGEYVGSCSDDGYVVINSLFTDESMKFKYHCPLKTIALDPLYSRKSSRRFVTGGLAGHLYLNSKTWIGYRDQVLHSGEGPIHAVKWRTGHIACVNDSGVKVYDTVNDKWLAFIERPQGSPCPELLVPHLVWQDDTLLVIGWGTSVRIAAIRTNQYNGVNMVQRSISISSTKHVDIVASFQTRYFISGIAPYGDALVVLAYIPEKKDEEKELSGSVPSCQSSPVSKPKDPWVKQFEEDAILARFKDGHILITKRLPIFKSFGDVFTISFLLNSFGDYRQVHLPQRSLSHTKGTAQRPEVHVVTWKNDKLATDALPVLGFEHYNAKDYSLAHAPFSGSSYAGGQWAAGDEPLYYIVSPKDVVIAKPRDAEDHISWLLQHGCHEKALAAVEAGQGRTELLDEVGLGYLDHLILERKYAEAASLCPKLLRGSVSAWERWVFHFAQLRQLPVLIPYIPTENPRLRDTAYEVALVGLATNPSFHKDLLSTVKSWPPAIYSSLPVLSAIEPQLNTSSTTDTLKEALAELYVINAQYERALALYADLMKPETFDFIEKHNLHDAIHDKVVQLMVLDCKHAILLLIQHKDLITPSEVVSQILDASAKCDSRYFLHLYLHSLFEVDPHAGKDFHNMQVELYSDYDPKMLLPFLRSSQHYTLEKAYDICVKRDLLREQVFILGRMGNSKQALAVIINRLEDIEEAIEFVAMQHDDELWEELIKQCLHKPEMVGVLLEHTVGNLDPLYIVKMVPNGLTIPRLRDRLVKIITDYRTETSLRHGCNDIIKADSVNLLVKYYKEARHAVYLGSGEEETRAKRHDSRAAQATGKLAGMGTVELKSKTGGGGRCCVCFDPFSIQNVSVIVFFCCHAYHVTCLMDSTNSARHKSGARATFQESVSSNGYNYDDDDDDDDVDDTQVGASHSRCILCTTAAG